MNALYVDDRAATSSSFVVEDASVMRRQTSTPRFTRPTIVVCAVAVAISLFFLGSSLLDPLLSFSPVVVSASALASHRRRHHRLLRDVPDGADPNVYSLGNFSVRRDGQARFMTKQPRYHLPSFLRRLGDYLSENKARIFYLFVFGFLTCDSLPSIWDDEWAAERNPEKYFSSKWFGRGWRTSERKVVKRRVLKDRTIRQLVGAGYTPRLVFLFGVMLRGILHCTAMPKIFEPTLGWGAGSVLAARFAHREWLPTILLGWFGSHYYWKWFGVDGPPQNPPDKPFDGFPITIHKVRL